MLILSNVFYQRVSKTMDDLAISTNGIVSPQLLFPMLTLAVVTFVILRIGQLRAVEIGLRKSGLFPAAGALLFFWIGIQLLLFMIMYGRHNSWSEFVAPNQVKAALGPFVGQLIGNALLEETFFRGYLFRHLFLRLSRSLPAMLALISAGLVSLGLFVLSHVPRLVMHTDALAGELLWTSSFGLALTLVYCSTGNIFVCIGIHAIYNANPTLVEASWQTVDCAWWTLTTILIAIAFSRNRDLRSWLSNAGNS
jgi:membrane protease YdiL (CAAX protease family)